MTEEQIEKEAERYAGNLVDELDKNHSLFTVARSDMFNHHYHDWKAGYKFRDKLSGWISVKDRLPERYERVIISGGIGYISRDGNWYSITGIDYPGRVIEWEVAHWMPLPEKLE